MPVLCVLIDRVRRHTNAAAAVADFQKPARRKAARQRKLDCWKRFMYKEFARHICENRGW